MPTLRDLQRGFRAALLDDDAAVSAAVRGDGLAPTARLAIYRHHVLTTLTAALESTYPVVARLVDPRFFRYAADAYVRRHPPSSPCLFEYGATLADFLATFPPCRNLAYLPDVARLEWAMTVALHAPDVPPASPGDLRPGAAVALHPSVTVLASPWPVDAIWRANQPHAGDDTVALDGDAVHLQVWRADDEVVFRRLSATAATLRRTIARDGRLESAAELVLAEDPDADLPGLLRELLADRVLVRGERDGRLCRP
jgi:hypothetical protein